MSYGYKKSIQSARLVQFDRLGSRAAFLHYNWLLAKKALDRSLLPRKLKVHMTGPLLGGPHD